MANKGDIYFLDSTKPTKETEHFRLLIESGLYKEILVPPNVDLKDTNSELTQYYFMRLKEEYRGTIVIQNKEKVFILSSN